LSSCNNAPQPGKANIQCCIQLTAKLAKIRPPNLNTSDGLGQVWQTDSHLSIRSMFDQAAG
jgi:hypothetical protein